MKTNTAKKQSIASGTKIVPGAITIEFLRDTSLWLACEIVSKYGLTFAKNGIQYDNDFPPVMVRCRARVPPGEEKRLARLIDKEEVVAKADVIVVFSEKGGPFGC